MNSIGFLNLNKPLGFTENIKKQNVSSPIEQKRENRDIISDLDVIAQNNKVFLNLAQNKSIQSDSFEDFCRVLSKMAIENPRELFDNCTQENFLGAGANSRVYKFGSPDFSPWAIKLETKTDDYSAYDKLEKLDDEFEGKNMGQQIAKIGRNAYVLKRINAKQHSVSNWPEVKCNLAQITQEQAQEFLSSVKNISNFPQEAFDDFAAKLKLLDDKGYKADSFNPNNFLIDYKNKQLFIIDAYKYDVDAHLNSKYDLFCPLVDYANFEKFYNILDDASNEELIEASRILFEKCSIAAQKEGIDCSEETFREFISRIDSRENNGGYYTNNFEKMKEICEL